MAPTSCGQVSVAKQRLAVFTQKTEKHNVAGVKLCIGFLETSITRQSSRGSGALELWKFFLQSVDWVRPLVNSVGLSRIQSDAVGCNNHREHAKQTQETHDNKQNRRMP